MDQLVPTIRGAGQYLDPRVEIEDLTRQQMQLLKNVRGDEAPLVDYKSPTERLATIKAAATTVRVARR